MKSSDLLDDFAGETRDLGDLNFPLDFTFKITTLSNDFTVTDARGTEKAYVRQKMFRFKESVSIFSDTSKKRELYSIKADRWIDFNATYSFYDKVNEQRFGRVARSGMKSIWKSTYIVINEKDEKIFSIQEENPWAKVGDSLLGEIPVINILTGYLFHPRYIVRDIKGENVARLSKIQSFFGRRFKLEEIKEVAHNEQHLIMLSTMMMVLLERQRG